MSKLKKYMAPILITILSIGWCKDGSNSLSEEKKNNSGDSNEKAIYAENFCGPFKELLDAKTSWFSLFLDKHIKYFPYYMESLAEKTMKSYKEKAKESKKFKEALKYATIIDMRNCERLAFDFKVLSKYFEYIAKDIFFGENYLMDIKIQVLPTENKKKTKNDNNSVKFILSYEELEKRKEMLFFEYIENKKNKSKTPDLRIRMEQIEKYEEEIKRLLLLHKKYGMFKVVKIDNFARSLYLQEVINFYSGNIKLKKRIHFDKNIEVLSGLLTLSDYINRIECETYNIKIYQNVKDRNDKIIHIDGNNKIFFKTTDINTSLKDIYLFLQKYGLQKDITSERFNKRIIELITYLDDYAERSLQQ